MNDYCILCVLTRKIVHSDRLCRFMPILPGFSIRSGDTMGDQAPGSLMSQVRFRPRLGEGWRGGVGIFIAMKGEDVAVGEVRG